MHRPIDTAGSGFVFTHPDDYYADHTICKSYFDAPVVPTLAEWKAVLRVRLVADALPESQVRMDIQTAVQTSLTPDLPPEGLGMVDLLCISDPVQLDAWDSILFCC